MTRLVLLVCGLALATSALAQHPMPGGPGGGPGGGPDGRGPMHGPPPGGPGPGGPLDRFLYPPDVLLSNQIALGLNDDQVKGIKKLVGDTHGRVLDAQTDLRRIAERLNGTLETPKVDEAAAVALATQAMELEKQIKLAHLTMMIRAKNLLTPEQQEKASSLMPQRPIGPPEGRD